MWCRPGERGDHNAARRAGGRRIVSRCLAPRRERTSEEKMAAPRHAEGDGTPRKIRHTSGGILRAKMDRAKSPTSAAFCGWARAPTRRKMAGRRRVGQGTPPPKTRHTSRLVLRSKRGAMPPDMPPPLTVFFVQVTASAWGKNGCSTPCRTGETPHKNCHAARVGRLSKHGARDRGSSPAGEVFCARVMAREREEHSSSTPRRRRPHATQKSLHLRGGPAVKTWSQRSG